jgi:hypothetical protein
MKILNLSHPSTPLLQTYDSQQFDLEPETFIHYPPQEIVGGGGSSGVGRFANRGLRRSHSFATSSRYTEPSSTPLHRSLSRQSFSSEFQASFFTLSRVFLIGKVYLPLLHWRVLI